MSEFSSVTERECIQMNTGRTPSRALRTLGLDAACASANLVSQRSFPGLSPGAPGTEMYFGQFGTSTARALSYPCPPTFSARRSGFWTR